LVFLGLEKISDMRFESTHPQLVMLEQRIGYFVAHPEYELCVVVEPESQSIVRFHIPLKSKRGYRSADQGRIMEVELTPDEAVRADILLKMGFEASGRRKRTWQGEHNRIFPHFTKKITHGKRTASDVIRIMQEVFEVGETPWLWTFEIDDPNQWPDPLPRPEIWPPV